MSDKLFQKSKKKADDLNRQQVKQAAAILVVCEGETEGDYIRRLRKLWDIEKKVHLIDATQLFALKPLQKSAKNHLKFVILNMVHHLLALLITPLQLPVTVKPRLNLTSSIFCLFDKDDPNKFTEACQRTKSIRGGKVIKVTSVPCFEYWLLLHFERVDAPLFSVTNVIARLGNTALSDYSNANKRIDEQRFSLLSADNNIDNATQWSKELFERVQQFNTDDPSTRMFELMKVLKKLNPLLDAKSLPVTVK